MESRFEAMGTEVHLVVAGEDEARRLLHRGERMIRELEQRWSRFLPSSEISRLNALGGRPCVVSDHTFTLVSRAAAGWHATGGRYDPTVLLALVASGYAVSFEAIDGYPMVSGTGEPAPGAGEIELIAGANLVRLPVGVEIDPGGIGKGLAADLVAEELMLLGATGVCVNLGGDLRITGSAPGRRWWSVDVDPTETMGRALQLRLTTGAVATSTRLRRTWAGHDGPRHHLVDPRTGQPARSGLASVVVVAGEAWRAEVLAKAAFVAGADHGTELVEEAGASALLVTDAGEVVSAGRIGELLG